MTLISDGVRYWYPSSDEPAVNGMSLSIKPGSFVLLTGPTGCGKSTWLRLAAGLLQNHGSGRFEGQMLLDGSPVGAIAPSNRVRSIGFVSQTPHDQIVSGTVGDEVAFGLESAGIDPADLDPLILQALNVVELAVDRDRPTLALSGGQLARLVVAGAIAGSPPLLLLDEPLAQLDPAGAEVLLQTLRRIADRGTAVVMVEHRVHLAADTVDRVIVMNDGTIAGEGTDHLQQVGIGLELPRIDPPQNFGPELIAASKLRYRYEDTDLDALDGVDFTVQAGERIAVMGPNGSGKSTLLRAIAGLIKAGAVTHNGRVIDVPQDPDLALFCPTVRSELAYGPEEHRLQPEAVAERVSHIAEALNLTPLLERAPQSLSRGQRLRVAVGAAMSVQPDVLLLDEPTSGQDRTEVVRLMRALTAASQNGAVVFATHDEELAEAAATRIVRMEAGRVVSS
jgi:energy-coupling factor transporter ATP-binding protein EcfA2